MCKLIKKLSSIALAAFVVLGGLPMEAQATTPEARRLQQPTKAQVQEMYSLLAPDRYKTATYDVEPSGPDYVAGRVSDETTREVVDLLNLYRYVIGLPADVSCTEEYQTLAQHGAAVQAYNGNLSHYPAKPAGMPEDFYQLALEGAGRSNLINYGAYPYQQISEWMNDSDVYNIAYLGHRAWMLNPGFQETGYGRVGTYGALMVSENYQARKNFQYDYYTWPARYTPYELYSPYQETRSETAAYAFSVHLGDEYDTPRAGNVTVKVTSKLQNKTWTLNQNSTNVREFLNVTSGMVVFNVGGFACDDVVTVNITGLTKGGVAAPINYTVEFFSASDMTQPSYVYIGVIKRVMDVGDYFTIKPTVYPSTATNKTVTMVSSNPEVATIDAKGVVRGIGPGTTTITVTSVNGKTATCTVVVNGEVDPGTTDPGTTDPGTTDPGTTDPGTAEPEPDILPTFVSVDVSSRTLYEGESFRIASTVYPQNATDKTVTMTSSNPAVATVNKDGKVTALKAGTTTITVTTVNGKKATCVVTVKAQQTSQPDPDVLPVSVSLDASSCNLWEGESFTIRATVYPQNAKDKTVTMTSGNPAVATVDKDGKVMALKAGTTTITVTTVNGKKATCTVTVRAQEVSQPDPEPTPEPGTNGISLSQDSITMPARYQQMLYATVDGGGAVTWTTSDPAVAYVGSNGNVIARDPGTCVITATSSGQSATCVVKVTDNPQIEVEKAVSLKVGETYAVEASAPGKTSGGFSYRSSRPEVVTISPDGVLTAKSAGFSSVSVSAMGCETVYIMVNVGENGEATPVVHSVGLSARYDSKDGPSQYFSLATLGDSYYAYCFIENVTESVTGTVSVIAPDKTKLLDEVSFTVTGDGLVHYAVPVTCDQEGNYQIVWKVGGRQHTHGFPSF